MCTNFRRRHERPLTRSGSTDRRCHRSRPQRHAPCWTTVVQVVADREQEKDVVGAAELAGTFENCLEHRADFGRRAAMTLRISAVAVLPLSVRLRLVEEPHIFDGDHGLVSERLQQLERDGSANTPISRRVHDDETDGGALAHHRVHVTLRYPRARPKPLGLRIGIVFGVSGSAAVCRPAPRREVSAPSDAAGNAIFWSFRRPRTGQP